MYRPRPGGTGSVQACPEGVVELDDLLGGGAVDPVGEHQAGLRGGGATLAVGGGDLCVREIVLPCISLLDLVDEVAGVLGVMCR